MNSGLLHDMAKDFAELSVLQSQCICCFTAWVAIFFLFCCCVCMMSVTKYLFVINIILISCSIFSGMALQNSNVTLCMHMSCALLLNFQLKIYFKFRPQFLTQFHNVVWLHVVGVCHFLVNISFSFVPRFSLPSALSLGLKNP